jgi:hypothetical protein
MNKGTYRDALITVLGGRCSCTYSDCWHNGSCRVSDKRCLQVDHVNGGGGRDRERFGNDESMFRYYLEHFGEEGRKLQVLCANCNQMKVAWNNETRRPRYHDGLAKTMELLPDYPGLVSAFRSLITSITKAEEPTLADELRRCGLDETAKHPLSYYLCRNWSRQKFYANDSESLVVFLSEKMSMLATVAQRLDIRLGITGQPGKADNPITKTFLITKTPPITR